MAISGYFSDFSLAEVFYLLEKGNKTGRLGIRECMSSGSQSDSTRNCFYLWFKQGNIVAASNTLDGNGLLRIIQQRGWLSSGLASRITDVVCVLDEPVGLCLKAKGLLESEQLKLVFAQQVLQQVCKLFEMPDAQFLFSSNTSLPNSEMTGLIASPKEVTLAGLRVLRDWSVLQEKLPEETSALLEVSSLSPKLRLNQSESRVWEFTNGKVSLKSIATRLQLPIEKVRQIAFRLIVVGLVEEVPFVAETPAPQVDKGDYELNIPEWRNLDKSNKSSSQNVVSSSFLQNLVGFLKTKTSS